MATVTAQLPGFATEMSVALAVFDRLGQCRTAADYEDFQTTLTALGMDVSEVRSLWEAKNNHVSANDWQQAKSNTQLSECLGILLDSTLFPRNWLLYRVIECLFRDTFGVTWNGQPHLGGKQAIGRQRIVFDRPLVSDRGDALAVYRACQGEQPVQIEAAVIRSAGPLRATLGEVMGLELAELLFNTKMLIPPPTIARLLARVVHAGLAGGRITLVGAFCPDYAYEATGNPLVPYRYTFDGVGEGVGLVAQQFVRIVPVLSAFLQAHGINHQVVLSIGDFEADSAAVLQRVGLDRTEFVRRCQASLDAFAQQVAPNVPLELELFSQRRGAGRFRQLASCAKNAMLAGNFGAMPALYPDLDDVISGIPEQYGTFYERWYGRDMPADEVREIVLAQGSEYAALARMYVEDFGPLTIMLAGDRPEMHRFNAFFQVLPTLCAKRAY